MTLLEPSAQRECDPCEHRYGIAVAAVPLNAERVEEASRIFRALGDAARLRLLAHLLSGDRCVGDLAEMEGESLPAISQRLKILYSEKILRRQRLGKHVSYGLADQHIVELVSNVLAHVAEGKV